MGYIVFHKEFPNQDKRWFKTVGGARRSATCTNRNLGTKLYEVLEETLFMLKYPIKMKTVKNLMTGQEIQIPEDTPYCCDPSQERYWSM
jgi:hypothetical protein